MIFNWLRRKLQLTDLKASIENLSDAIAAYDAANDARSDRLTESLLEVRSLLGLSTDDAPTSRDQLDGSDPHGL